MSKTVLFTALQSITVAEIHRCCSVALVDGGEEIFLREGVSYIAGVSGSGSAFVRERDLLVATLPSGNEIPWPVAVNNFSDLQTVVNNMATADLVEIGKYVLRR